MHLSAEQKVGLLVEYGRSFGLRRLVETGLYNGNGSGMHTDGAFDSYTIIDCQASNVCDARARGYACWFGDSAQLLPRILERLGPAPALFWLDAHAIVDDPPSWPGFPLHGEIAAIAAWPGASESVILVDDLWMFGGGSPQPLRGAGPLDELRFQVRELDLWRVEESDEVMRLTPKGVE